MTTHHLNRGQAGVLVEEQRREDLVRTLPCPTCGAKAGATCRDNGGKKMFMAHFKRYDLAADAGVVPVRRG
jgi:hypothetical protein